MNRQSPRILAACCVLAVGCAPKIKTSLTAQDPSAKVPAIKEAADTDNEQAVGKLVKALSSDDPAVRLFAAEALKRITGQTLGYSAYADEPDRKRAVGRWNQYVVNQQ